MKQNIYFDLEVYQSIINDSNFYIFIINFDDNRILYQNRTTEKFFGNQINKKFKDFSNFIFLNNDFNNLMEDLKLFIDYRGKPKPPIQGELLDKNSNKSYYFNLFSIINKTNKYKVLQFVDFTSYQEKINEYEKEIFIYKKILEEIQLGLWLYDSDGNYKIFNSYLDNIMKFKDGNWSVSEDEIKVAYDNNQEVLKKKQSTIKYEEYTLNDGKKHLFKIIRKRIYHNNKVLGVLGIGNDITEIKGYEEKLKYFKGLNEIISELSTNLINGKISNIDEFIIDGLKEIGKYTDIDRICFYNVDLELNKINLNLILNLNSNNKDYQELKYEHIQRWIDRFTNNYFIIINDISQIPITYNLEKMELEKREIKTILAFPLISNNELFGFISFENTQQVRFWDNDTIFSFRIITEIIAGALAKKTYENKLLEAINNAEEANRTKSEFLANMSHEIRTPMNAILGFSEILQETITSGVQKQYLDTIINSSRNLMKLINDILDLSKIEAGRIDISPEPVNLKRVFYEIEKIFEIKIKDKQLDFIIEVDENLDKYWLFDETRIRQILFNVVGNAIKFTDKGYIKIISHLEIEPNTNKKNIILCVEDSGIGIAEEHQKRIFESFYQVSSKSGKKYEGTGLGLAITMKLIKAMNGEIMLESKTNEGTKFTIKFKDVASAEISIRKQEENYKTISKEFKFNGERFLVVDDIDNNRELIKIYLEEHNAIVLEASSGKDAIKLASFYRPSAILLDIRMPEMSGFEVLNILRQEERTFDIPVIALTAVSSAFQEKHLYRNFNGVLTKPVRKDELLNKLIDILKLS